MRTAEVQNTQREASCFAEQTGFSRRGCPTAFRWGFTPDPSRACPALHLDSLARGQLRFVRFAVKPTHQHIFPSKTLSPKSTSQQALKVPQDPARPVHATKAFPHFQDLDSTHNHAAQASPPIRVLLGHHRALSIKPALPPKRDRLPKKPDESRVFFQTTRVSPSPRTCLLLPL
jgi:hypothetical protein